MRETPGGHDDVAAGHGRGGGEGWSHHAQNRTQVGWRVKLVLGGEGSGRRQEDMMMAQQAMDEEEKDDPITLKIALKYVADVDIFGQWKLGLDCPRGSVWTPTLAKSLNLRGLYLYFFVGWKEQKTPSRSKSHNSTGCRVTLLLRVDENRKSDPNTLKVLFKWAGAWHRFLERKEKNYLVTLKESNLKWTRFMFLNIQSITLK